MTGTNNFITMNVVFKLYGPGELFRLNSEYQVATYLPDGLLLGSDGGGEGLVMDLRPDSDTLGEFYMVPFVPMGWADARYAGKSLAEANEFLKNRVNS